MAKKINNLTAVLITFLRPGYTKACVASLRKMYPGIKIIVAENGEWNDELDKFCRAADARYIRMPYDSGVCIARNELVRQVETDYVLVGDDDFFYDKNAGVDKMVQFLENKSEFDLIGGRVSEHGVIKNYQGFITKKPDHFQSDQIDPKKAEYKIDEVSGLKYCKADLTFNYFVARTEKVKDVLWDELIKVAYEHYSWFYDFKLAGGRVAFSPDPIVIHKNESVDPEQSGDYASFRNRKCDRDRFFEKYEIKYTISMNGRKTYGPNYMAPADKTVKRIIRKGNDIKFVDFCITTFERPKALERLLISIAKYYPMANVYIADQSKVFDRKFYRATRAKLMKTGLIKRMSVDQLPYDCGLSYARNYLVDKTPNKYKLILDDDFEFIDETDIGKFVQLLDKNPGTAVVGGLVKQNDVEIHFEFDLDIKNRTIFHRKDKNNWKNYNGIRYRKTGCVLNFALMRKDLFTVLKWDPNLKVTEHTDFYLRIKNTPYRVMYTPDVIVNHPPVERSGDYKQLRQRTEFIIAMFRKHKVDRMKYLNGQVNEIAPDGKSIKRYKEPSV